MRTLRNAYANECPAIRLARGLLAINFLVCTVCTMFGAWAALLWGDFEGTYLWSLVSLAFLGLTTWAAWPSMGTINREPRWK